MSGVLLGDAVAAARKARQVVVAPRLPEAPKVRTGDPFKDDGDVVVDCDRDGCGWHAIGPRTQIKAAVANHLRVYHPDEVGVVLLNTPRQ